MEKYDIVLLFGDYIATYKPFYCGGAVQQSQESLHSNEVVDLHTDIVGVLACCSIRPGHAPHN